MKKTLLFIAVLLGLAGTAKAGEYVAFQPAEPFRISWDNSSWAGSYYDTSEHSGEGAWTSLSAGDVIKIHVTGVVGTIDSDCQVSISFKPHEYDWTNITASATVNLENGIITVPVTNGSGTYGSSNTAVNWTADEMAAAIKARGFVVSGIKYRMLDISVETTNVTTDGFLNTTLRESHNCGSWSGTSIINAGTAVTTDDYITCTVTLNTSSNTGQALFQYMATTWTTLANGQVWMNADAEANNATIHFCTEDVENINTYGLALNGDNVTVTDVVYHKKLTLPGYRPVYIPDGGYATFYGASTCALPEGVKAYYVSAAGETSATLTEISNIPANQGVILQGTTGIYQLYTTDDEAASVTGNMLSGSVTRQQIAETTNKYVLYDNNGTPEFRPITANSYLDAYKCYLTTTATAPALSVVFGDDETTSIATPKTTVTTNDRIYNLSGQEVKVLQRGGIYIKNGKKIIVK